MHPLFESYGADHAHHGVKSYAHRTFDLGHMIHHEAPEEIAGEIDRFVGILG